MNSLDSALLLAAVHKVSPESIVGIMEEAYKEVWLPLYNEGKSEQYVQDRYDRRIESRVKKLPKLAPPKQEPIEPTEKPQIAPETTKEPAPMVEHRENEKSPDSVAGNMVAHFFIVMLTATLVFAGLKWIKWLWVIL